MAAHTDDDADVAPDGSDLNLGGSDDNDNDNNNDEIATHIAQYENGLEPPHCTRPPSKMADPAALDQEMGSKHEIPTADNDMLWNTSCREAKLDLENCPFVTPYPGGMAGAVHSKANMGENQKYEHQMGEESQENLYAPFTLKLDWEVAKCAKMRGLHSLS